MWGCYTGVTAFSSSPDIREQLYSAVYTTQKESFADPVYYIHTEQNLWYSFKINWSNPKYYFFLRWGREWKILHSLIHLSSGHNDGSWANPTLWAGVSTRLQGPKGLGLTILCCHKRWPGWEVEQLEYKPSSSTLDPGPCRWKICLLSHRACHTKYHFLNYVSWNKPFKKTDLKLTRF